MLLKAAGDDRGYTGVEGDVAATKDVDVVGGLHEFLCGSGQNIFLCGIGQNIFLCGIGQKKIKMHAF